MPFTKKLSDGERLMRAEIVAESARPNAKVADVAHKYGIPPLTLHKWRYDVRTGAFKLPFNLSISDREVIRFRLIEKGHEKPAPQPVALDRKAHNAQKLRENLAKARAAKAAKRAQAIAVRKIEPTDGEAILPPLDRTAIIAIGRVHIIVGENFPAARVGELLTALRAAA